MASLWGGLKRLANKAKEAVVGGAIKGKEKVSKSWNAITGRATFKEAEELYNKIEKNYNKYKGSYDAEILEIREALEYRVRRINAYKTATFNEHFERLKAICDRVHHLEVNGEPFVEIIDKRIMGLPSKSAIRKKNELYVIDFNDFSFSDWGMSIITLGAFSRKRAKETLSLVKEEEVRLEEEICKMNAHLKKMGVVRESIKNIDYYFDYIVSNFLKLLSSFEYGVQSQFQKHLLSVSNDIHEKLDFRLLPIVHLKEFQALFNLSIVLKEMAMMQYLSSTGEVIEEDSKQFLELCNKSEELGYLQKAA
jgi:hypothetical protein